MKTVQTTLSSPINNIFSRFIKKKTIFRNKSALQSGYTPKQILHREDQIQAIASILAPSLRGELPSNIFIYGKTGTGKTCVVKYIGNHLQQQADIEKQNIQVIYVNIELDRVADTEYRLFAYLSNILGKPVPSTGLPTSQVYDIFKQVVKSKETTIILILDEIDKLISKAGDSVIYHLTRINTDIYPSKICFIGITNDIKFINSLEPRVISSLSKEEVVFPPYNALQLQAILSARAKEAFFQDVIDDAVIRKCAARAATEHGDARRALDLLRVAAEIAERNNSTRVTLEHVEMAEEKIDYDTIVEVVKSLPTHSKAVILSVIRSNQNELTTGEVYSAYVRICNQAGIKSLSQRRISDIIGELDNLGIINASIKNSGRYGRTRIITLALSGKALKKISSLLIEEFNTGFLY